MLRKAQWIDATLVACEGINALALGAIPRHVLYMMKPRTPFFVSVLLGILGGVLAATLKAIFDVTVQDFWKDTVTPFLREHVGLWSATTVEWIGPYWCGFVSAFLLMFCVETLCALHRKHRAENKPEQMHELLGVESLIASRALLRLRFSGQLEAPEEIAKENIQSWFAYWSPGGRAEDQNGKALFEIPSSWAIFLTFERPVTYRQLAAHFTGARPTAWQVRQTLPNVAVLTLEGGMPECELEIITRT